MKSFNLKLIAPDGIKYESEAEKAILPTPNGQITILANHLPIVSLLSAGEIILEKNNKKHYLITEGGLVEIANNTVKILADTAEDANTIDELKVEEAKKKAAQRMIDAENEMEYTEAAVLLEKQLAKLSALKKRKKYR